MKTLSIVAVFILAGRARSPSSKNNFAATIKKAANFFLSTTQRLRHIRATNSMMKIFIFLSIFLTASCAVNISYDELTPEEKIKFETIKIYETNIEASYIEHGLVEGKVCHRHGKSGVIEKSKIIEALKLSAARAGVDAVINVKCHVNQMDDYIHNCWGTGICAGTGIKFE